MDDSWENGDDNGGNGGNGGNGPGGGSAGFTHGPPPKASDEGFRPNLEAAFEHAWQEVRHDPDCVYGVDIYVKGNNPISGYRVVLNPTGP
jgi:hypothetical protein